MIYIQFAFNYHTRKMPPPRIPLMTEATIYADDLAVRASVRTPSGA